MPRQVCFETGLELGFPIDGDANRRLTVYAAWCLFFREGLKDDNDERPFKAYVIAKLEELSAVSRDGIDNDALANDVSRKLIEKLAQRVSDVEYFDRQFKEVINRLDAMLDLLRKDRLAVLPEAGQLPASRRDFVGRTAIRAALAQRIRAGEAQHIVGMHGQSGVGKSELAIVVGHDVIDRFPGGQLLINLQGDKPNPPGPAQAIATARH